MLTDKDIIKLIDRFIQVFATKDDLKNLPTLDQFGQLRSDVYDKMDSVYKEVVSMRHE